MNENERNRILTQNQHSLNKDEGEEYINTKAGNAGFIGFIIIWFIVFSILNIQGNNIPGAGLAIFYGGLGSKLLSIFLQVRKNSAYGKKRILYLLSVIISFIVCIFNLLRLLKVF